MATRFPPDDAVFTPTDLANWAPSDVTWLAVLGHPIKHSISPAMHNAALAVLAEADPSFRSWRYIRVEVEPDALPETLHRLRALGFHGLNLTVPHKVIAFDRIQHVDTAARPIGAVNTLLAGSEGWKGFNTDGYGLATGMLETLGADLQGAAVVLLGAGGAARGAAVECLLRKCSSLWIGNRTPANRDALLRDLQPVAGVIPLRGFDPNSPPSDIPAGAWVINATSAGLKSGDPAPINLETLSGPAGVYDMIYNPPETPLLAQARALGLPAANGLSMLVHQGARALEIWTGRKVPVAAMQRAAEAAMKR